MNQIFKRVLLGVLSAVMAVSAVPIVSAHAAESTEPYPYTMFAASSDEGAITVNAGNFCVNGNVATNGTIVSSGNMNINGTKTENADESMIFIFDKIDNQYFSDSNVDEHDENYTLDELNININVPTEVQGEATLTGNININSALKALEDVRLYGEIKNTNDSVIFSKYGDIVIDSQNVNLNGLVYAPFGSVIINAQNLNLNNVVIIAESIVLTCPNVNANYSTNIGDFVGNESEGYETIVTDIDFYAYGDYDSASNSIGIFWIDSNETGNYRVYEDEHRKTIVCDSCETSEYYYNIEPNNSKNDYVFFVERVSPDGNVSYSNFVTFTLNEEGNYEFVDIDSDDDGLSDLDELDIESDRLNSDSDGDGLLDGYEFFTTDTDPLIPDTDDNGILDGDEDFDIDNLSNKQEFVYQTNPYNCDTDEDSFPDDYEINHGMNPTIADEIRIDENIAFGITDNTVYDLEVLNLNEYYPLEIDYNDYHNLKSLSGVYSDYLVETGQDALYSLYSVKTLIGIDNPAQELRFIKSNRSNSGSTYSFKQYYKNLNVYGRSVTVSVGNDFIVTSLNSSYIDTDILDTIDTTPVIDEVDVQNIIHSSYGEDVNAVLTELIIYIDTSNTPILAYVSTTSNNETIIIDANTCEILYYDDNINEGMVEGSGFDETGYTTLHFEVNKKGIFNPTYTLEDTKRKICMYDRSNSDKKYTSKNRYIWSDYTAVTAYSNVIKAFDWWKSSYSYIGLNGKKGAVPVYVHDPKYNNNAFYSSDDTLHFCDTSGSSISKASALDCIGHEYTHAIFHHTVISHSSMTARTISESYADIFGSIINNNTWRTYPRNIANPSATFNPSKASISDSNYDPLFSEEHKNATILPHAAYLMESKYHFDFAQLSQLWYDSMSEGIDDSSDLNTIRDNVIKSARKNNYTYDEITDIRKAFENVGIEGSKGNANITVLEGSNPIEDVGVMINSYSDFSYLRTNSSGIASFNNLNIGMNTVRITIDGREPILTHIMIENGKTATKTINILTSETEFEWKYYDHYYYPERYGTTLSKHIDKTERDVKMTGYTVDPIKDFMLTNENDDPDSFIHYEQKVVSFNIKRDANNWHTMEGGGMLFDVEIKDALFSDTKYLTAHCVLITESGLKIYYLDSVNLEKFRNGKLGNIANIAECIGTYDIGNVLDKHKITIEIDKSAKKEVISIWDGNHLIVEPLEIKKLKGDDFGPITSHISHACSQVSYFTFSDIQMSSISMYKGVVR